MADTASSTLRRLTSGASVFALTSAFRAGLSFVLLPVLASVIAPDAYGTLALITALMGVTGITAGLGLEIATFRAWFAEDDDGSRRRSLATLRSMVLVGTAGVVGLVVLATLVGLLDGLAPRSWILVALVGTAANTVGASFVAPVLRASQRLAPFAVLNVGWSLVQAALQLVLLLGLGRGVFGWLLGAAMASVGLAATGLAVTHDQARGELFDRQAARRGLRLGLPMLPHGLAHWGLSASDRFVLGAFTTTAVVGHYSLAYAFAGFVQLTISEFNRALMVELGSLVSTPNRTRASVLSYLQAMVAVLIGTWAAVLGPNVIVLLFPEDYGPAANLLPWIVPGIVLFGLYLVVANLLSVVVGRTGALWPASLLAAVGNLAGNLALVPRLGARGAALGTILGYLLLVVTTGVAASRHAAARIDPPTPGFVLAVLGVVGTGALAAAVTSSQTAGGLVLRLALLAPTAWALVPLVRRLHATDEHVLDEQVAPPAETKARNG